MTAMVTVKLEVFEALEDFLSVVHQMDMGPLDHFTCTEVESLARLMAAAQGEAAGMSVIVHHFWDSDEEHDELAQHLENWPGLREDIRETFSEDAEIVQILNELEEDGR